MKRYKIWVEIEEYDSKTDDYQDAPGAEPVDIAAGLTFKEATEMVRAIASKFADVSALEHWRREGIYPFENQHRNKLVPPNPVAGTVRKVVRQ